ncbi:hypothetical protein LEP1GSC173_0722 [Leptospira interrogans str. HAI1594]|nr:hypothetical protein LEP1GSC173_0722 [Leptospira interrogans str. HAI1594]EMO20106.1 hypothetical protein LEP1GSC167_2938 [Leptospira interrogans serovar Copenhageni str. HAI0188]
MPFHFRSSSHKLSHIVNIGFKCILNSIFVKFFELKSFTDFYKIKYREFLS